MAVTYVIDASAAIKAFVEEQDSDAARSLLATPSILLAPAHSLAECGEILVRKALTGEISRQQAYDAVAALRQSIGYVALDGLIDQAVEIAFSTGASVYDTLYVATARTVGCKLVTEDERLIRRLAGLDALQYCVRLRALAL